MGRRADLSPPLGSPGGPCRVVQRIQDKVQDSRLRDHLVREIETGRSLENPEAARVYDLEVENLPGGVKFKKVVLGPHAEYRMDLRTITVPLILKGVQNFVKAMMDSKAQGTSDHRFHGDLLARGTTTEWQDPKQKLTLVLSLAGPETLKVVTTYWTGKKDPRPPRKCPAPKYGYREPASALPGAQTFVQNPDGTQDRDPQWLGSNPDKEKAHVAPKSRSRQFPQPAYNRPPASGEGPDGKSLSQDKPRTKGKPGDEYGSPSLNWPQEGPHRRTMKGDFYLERAPAKGPDPSLRYDRGTKPLAPPHGEFGQGLNIHEVTEAPGSAKVIPSWQGFVNKEASKINDLEFLTSLDIQQRAKGLPVKLRRVDARNNMWLFDVQGKSGIYRVKVKAFPLRPDVKDPKKVDIRMSCSCPYWRWQGPEFHAKQEDYQYGPFQGTASPPDIKDPQREHGVCKHAWAVLQLIKGWKLPGRERQKTASSLVQRIARRYLESKGVF